MYTASDPKPINCITFDDIRKVNADLDDDNEDAVMTRPRKKHRTSRYKDSNDYSDPLKIRPVKKHRSSRSKESGRQLNFKKVTHPTRVDVQNLSDGLVSCAEMEVQCLKNPTTTTLSREDIAHDLPRKHLGVDCHVEVLSQDSGIRGCWFRAVVIKRSKEKVKLRYENIMDAEDETKNLEEWVFASRIAAADQLGIRLTGRTTIRPFPPSSKDGNSMRFVDVGTPVDAWWHDGWWEGIVVRNESDEKIHVYFPGEKKMSIFMSNDLRFSQDWLCDQWFSRECRPDLASSILSGIETQKDVGKSCDGGSPVEPVVSNKEPSSDHIMDSSPIEGDKATCNQNASLLEPQSDVKSEIEAVTNLAKDNFLFQLRWNPSRKRKRCRERSQRGRNSCLKQNSDGSSSSNSSREDCDLVSDCRRLLATDSLKFDQESCKYQRGPLLNASIPSLTGLVLSR